MDPTLVSYYAFGALFLIAVGLVVYQRFKAKRDQEELEAKLGLRPQPVTPVTTTSTPVAATAAVAPAAPAVIQPLPATSAYSSFTEAANGASTVAANVSAAAEAKPYGTQPEQAPTTERYAANRFSQWAEAERKTWEPSPESIYRVTWANQELFGKEVQSFDEGITIPKINPDQVPSVDTSDYTFGPMTAALAGVLPATDVERVAKELKQAGYYQPHAMQNLAATRFMIGFFAFIICGGILLMVPPRLEPFAAGAMFLIPATLWALPRITMQNKGAKRKSELERSMPDMLDMLNMCVSQGLTIPQSLKRIAKDLKPVYPVLASELGIVVHQSEVGNLRVALDNFAERVEVPEVDSFVTLMNQSEKMGTSISDALTEYSNTMRESLRQRTDEKANQASFKLMFPTVMFMMPAVFMFLMGPAILELQAFFDNGGMDNVTQGVNTLNTTNNLGR